MRGKLRELLPTGLVVCWARGSSLLFQTLRLPGVSYTVTFFSPLQGINGGVTGEGLYMSLSL